MRVDAVLRHGSMPAATNGLRGAAVVGPNAIIQTGTALRDIVGPVRCRAIFEAAGIARYLAEPPLRMVDEREVRRLFTEIEDSLPAATAVQALSESGRRTGDYIIAHRIPAPARRLIRAMPAQLGARVLMFAIGRHAWTFAGSGMATCTMGSPLGITIAANPLATSGCPWHMAVFERLFGQLVSDRFRARHVSCCAAGATACRTELTLDPAD